jgi:Ni/Fe-hydrogenase 1 B-type cytochrome subunit
MANIYCHTLPARILHWINAANIGLLTTTGLYIRDPWFFPFFANMDIARKTHFIAMYLIIYGILIRIYYSYISKDYRDLLFRFRDFKGFPELIWYYLFFNKTMPDYGKYNPGQKLLYNSWVVLVFFQSFTGFLLYFQENLILINRFLGGSLIIRQVHFLLTWVFIVTVALHVYLSFIGGWTVVKSMITGYFPEGECMQPTSVEESKEVTVCTKCH